MNDYSFDSEHKTQSKSKLSARSDNGSDYNNTMMVQVNLEPVWTENKKGKKPSASEGRKTILIVGDSMVLNLLKNEN